jgi:hypothetical protein
MMPTTSEVDICNQALDLIKAPNISSLTESSEAARKCNRHYAKCRDTLLEEYPWNFAIQRATFSEDTEEPLFEYEHQYVIPSDCLRILSIYNYTGPWRREGQRLLVDIDSSSSDSCYVRYIKKVTDVSDFDPMFVEALVYRLAAKLAIAIRNDEDLAERYEKKEIMMVMKAERLHAIEDTSYEDENEDDRDEQCSWVTEGR